MDMIDIKRMSKYDLTRVILLLVIFALFLVSQIKVSSILKLLATNYTKGDQEEDAAITLTELLDTQDSEVQAHPTIISQVICNRSHPSHDICSIEGSSILDPKTFTFYVKSHSNSPPQLEKIKPYPRKWDRFRMSRIKEITVTSSPQSPPCEVQHNASALVFSLGGYTGDFFGDFSDELIPLFATINSILSGKDLILVIFNLKDWWIWKYGDLLRSLTKNPFINLDKDTATHCFPSSTVGLLSLDLMRPGLVDTTDPKVKPIPHTIRRFSELLKKTYGHKHPYNYTSPKSRPRLVLVGRSGAIGRVIMNHADVKKAAEEEGFDVIDFQPKYATSLSESHALASTSHVVVGVYGAGLTHLLFSRPGSVLIQVVPIGTEWLAKVSFQNMARDMGLEYMEYKLRVEESSLADKYGKDHVIVKDPEAFRKMHGGWTSHSVEAYLKEQNVRLDVVRFKGYLKKAYVKAKKFMEIEG